MCTECFIRVPGPERNQNNLEPDWFLVHTFIHVYHVAEK